MKKSRMEAFSDGVFAIIITIMVLELKIPHGTELNSLVPVIPVFLSYVLSFVFLAIYWNNHHHLCQAIEKVNGSILWANINLLFWLSLIPFVTGWMGENNFAPLPVALYGIVLLLDAIAYFILTLVLKAHHDEDSKLVKALGNDFKGKISLVIYIVAISLAFVNSLIAASLYIIVALIWLIPDKRFERVVG
jgi:uncharacterized membrane protein